MTIVKPYIKRLICGDRASTAGAASSTGVTTCPAASVTTSASAAGTATRTTASAARATGIAAGIATRTYTLATGQFVIKLKLVGATSIRVGWPSNSSAENLGTSSVVN